MAPLQVRECWQAMGIHGNAAGSSETDRLSGLSPLPRVCVEISSWSPGAYQSTIAALGLYGLPWVVPDVVVCQRLKDLRFGMLPFYYWSSISTRAEDMD